MLHQLVVSEVHADVYGSRVSVVGRLRAIHMVVWRAILVFAALVTHDFESAIGNYLIGIHVGGGAGAALNHVYREVIVMFAIENLAACLHYGLSLAFGKKSEFGISDSSAHLGDSEAIDKIGVFIEVKLADAEVLNTS